MSEGRLYLRLSQNLSPGSVLLRLQGIDDFLFIPISPKEYFLNPSFEDIKIYGFSSRFLLPHFSYLNILALGHLRQ